jgi:hypothetical protein
LGVRVSRNPNAATPTIALLYPIAGTKDSQTAPGVDP